MDGSPDAILVNTDEFEGLKETVAIRADLQLMPEIKHGLKELKSKKIRIYENALQFLKRKGDSGDKGNQNK